MSFKYLKKPKNRKKWFDWRASKPLFIIGVLLLIAILLSFFVASITWNSNAYYNLDGASPTDSTGVYDGANIGTIATGLTGIINNAFNFTAGYVNTTLPVAITGNDTYTISLWFKTNVSNQEMILASTTGANYDYFRFSGTSGKIAFPNTANETTLGYANNSWFHYVETKDVNRRVLYINGEVKLNTTYSQTITGHWIIGARNDLAQSFKGLIDEVGFWDRVLDSTEVSELYNSGTGLPYPGGSSVIGIIDLSNPIDDAVLSAVGANFTAYFNLSTGIYNWTNATYNIWNTNGSLFNSTFVTLPESNNTNYTQFIDDFTIGSYKWNIYGCYGNTTFSNCSWAASNYTYKVGATFSNVSYTDVVYETSTQYFNGTLKLVPGTELYDVKIVYNGTEHSGSFTEMGNNTFLAYSTIDINELESTTSQNKSFFFKLIYSVGAGSFLYENTTSYNQSVSSISLFGCSALNQNVTLNFTSASEENLTSIDTFNFLGTFEYWLGSGNVRKNISINNLSINSAALCIKPMELTYKSDAIIQYEQENYVKRNYYLYNASLNNLTQNITLYLLDSTQATAFIVSVKDGSQLPITDALVYVQRYYPGTGMFQTVSMAKTDGSGNTVIYFEAETEDYRIIVIKNGIVLYTSPIQKVYCSATPCTLPIQTESAGVSGWTRVGNLSNLIYTGPSYDKTTNLITYTYIDTSGTTHYGRLYVYQIENSIGKQTICDVNSTSNAATLTCNVAGYNGTIYAEAYISRSPETEILVWGVSFLVNTLKGIMGVEGLFWGLMITMILGIAGALIGGIPGGIIGVVLGLIASAWFGIATFGAVTIFGIIILGVVIIWLLKS